LTEKPGAKGQTGDQREDGKADPAHVQRQKRLAVGVSHTGGKSWFYRYKLGGKAHDVGLGSCDPAVVAELDGPSAFLFLSRSVSRGLGLSMRSFGLGSELP